MNRSPKSFSDLSDYRTKLKLQNKKTVASIPRLVVEKLLEKKGKSISPRARFASDITTEIAPHLLKKTKYPKTGQQIMGMVTPILFHAIEKRLRKSGKKKSK